MPSQIKDLYTSFRSSDIVVEQNVDVKLKTASPGVEGDPLIVRVNVYRPDTNNRYPVLCTYGPCECLRKRACSMLTADLLIDGKDIHYQEYVAFDPFSPYRPELSNIQLPQRLLSRRQPQAQIRVLSMGSSRPRLLDKPRLRSRTSR